MLKKKKAAAPKKKPLENHFILVIDNSVSMNWARKTVVELVNKHVDEIRKGAEASKQRTTFSLMRFAGDVEEMFRNKLISEIAPLTQGDYRADGSATALTDAAYEAIELGKSLPQSKGYDTTYVVTVITDGEDNSSRRTKDVLRASMSNVNKTDRWTISFMIPSGKKKAFLKLYEIPEGNVAEWDSNEASLKTAGDVINAGTQNYFATRTRGATNMTNYLQTNITASSKQIKKDLVDISKAVQTWNISKPEPIKDFAERRSRKPYIMGSVYYQLMKREEIQNYKGVIIMDKRTKAMYTGPDARDLIGLPNHNVKVEPGNHGNYDIFVQSTSPNRKLVQGTRALFYPPTGPVKPTWTAKPSTSATT